jgi:uncharacterized DUF497 family protein
VHLGRLVIDGPTRQKIHRKHNITFDEVVEAIQWPARARAAWEQHDAYGMRLVVVGSVATGREVLCILKPMPEWDDNADTWDIQTARWMT